MFPFKQNNHEGNLNLTLHEKCPKYRVISGPYFPVFSPNTGKYGPEITPYSDTFHAVSVSGEKLSRI